MINYKHLVPKYLRSLITDVFAYDDFDDHGSPVNAVKEPYVLRPGVKKLVLGYLQRLPDQNAPLISSDRVYTPRQVRQEIESGSAFGLEFAQVYEEELRDFVEPCLAKLRATSPESKLIIGQHEYSPEDLIREVEGWTELGVTIVDLDQELKKIYSSR